MLVQLLKRWFDLQNRKRIMRNIYTNTGLAVMCIAILSTQLNAQQRTITGTVTDGETEEVLPGVNVLVIGTSTGAVTNVDGQYKLEVSTEADSLLFSFIGYESQSVAIQGQSAIDVALIPQTYQGDELVVVGYGTQARETVTSSIASVDMEEVEGTPFGHPAKALQGKVAGAAVR